MALPGTPTYGTDATGQAGYATIVTCPAWETHNLYVAVDTNPATVSLDGGTTDHLVFPAAARILLTGLMIPPGTGIQAKNTGGSNYANLYMSVW